MLSRRWPNVGIIGPVPAWSFFPAQKHAHTPHTPTPIRDVRAQMCMHWMKLVEVECYAHSDKTNGLTHIMQPHNMMHVYAEAVLITAGVIFNGDFHLHILECKLWQYVFLYSVSLVCPSPSPVGCRMRSYFIQSIQTLNFYTCANYTCLMSTCTRMDLSEND